VALLGTHDVPFREAEDLVLHRRGTFPAHPNGMVLRAYDDAGAALRDRTYYSVGGGFVVDQSAVDADRVVPDPECARRSEDEVREGLLHLWQVMQECVALGTATEGVLPGRLGVR
jgi:L-serine dehydratase